MKLTTISALSLILVGLLSTVDAAVAPKTSPKANAPKANPPKASVPNKAASPSTTPSSSPNSTAPAPAPPGGNSTDRNGEGAPNGSPSLTGCVDGCGIYPPPAPDGNTANSLELYYLAWFPSYNAGSDTINMTFWTAYNPRAQGPPPTTLNIDLYDQFGKVKLGSIAQNVPVTSAASNVPFSLQTWKIPTTVNANFNVSNQFMVVFTGANNWRRDRLVQLNGIAANPGGGPNPAYANAVTGQTPSAGGSSSGPPGSNPSTTPGSNSASSGMSSGVKSDLFVVVCAWTFLVAQLVGFV